MRSISLNERNNDESLAASNPRGTTLGVLTTVAKQFREARREAGLPEDLVLYCARHTFGTALYEATGNLAMVMKVMGHADARTAMHYQHPTLDSYSRRDRPAEFTSQFTSQ